MVRVHVREPNRPQLVDCVIPVATIPGPMYRSAGRAAIASGVFALMAFGFLIVGVNIMFTRRPEWFALMDLMFKTHHVGVILQYVFMIPVVFGFDALARNEVGGVGRGTLAVGIVSLSLIVIFASLFLVDVVADDLYTVPQGILGVWLIVVNQRLTSVLRRRLTRFGTVVGFGLLLVGIFPLAYGILVDPIGLRGPVPPDYPSPDTTANTIIHIIFYIGTLLGVVTYPVWIILLGRRLTRHGIVSRGSPLVTSTPSPASRAPRSTAKSPRSSRRFRISPTQRAACASCGSPPFSATGTPTSRCQRTTCDCPSLAASIDLS